MKIVFLIITLVFFIVIYWGCTKTAMEPADDNQNTCTPKFPDKNVTYDNYVKGIIQTYCTPTCHNGGGGPSPGDFRTYKGLLQYTSEFQFRVIQDRADMPQGNAPLPKNIRDSLAIWIGNCTPEK